MIVMNAKKTVTGGEVRWYKRAIVLGVDGAGAFFKYAETPHMDKILRGGSTSYDVLTAKPTISAQCWGSMILGCTAAAHGLTND